MELEQAIGELLTKGGVSAAVGFVLSYFIPIIWPGFEALEPYRKRMTILELFIGIPVLATIVGIAANIIPDGSSGMIVQNLFIALEVGVMAYAGSQWGHAEIDVKRDIARGGRKKNGDGS